MALLFWDADKLGTDFDKIRLKDRRIYIHKDFRNSALEEALSRGKEGLQERYALTTIPSSEFARVYKFTVRFDGVERDVYFKQYFFWSVFHFIKDLFQTSRARRAFKATLMLAKNGFDVPTIAAMGERRFAFFQKEGYLLTFEVENSKQILQFIPRSSRNLTKEQLQSKRELIRTFGRTIGRMHTKGIFHGDLRLGNVLARQEKNRWRFFFLDNERTKRFRRLPARLQLKNLVQVNMGPSGMLTNTDKLRFFREYWAENGGSKGQKTALINSVIERTNQRLSKERKVARELRKCLRPNERYLRIETSQIIAMFNRVFCKRRGTEEPLDFIERIDALMDKGHILKQDDTTYVSSLTWNGKDVVVKRFNHKGFIHSLRHTIKKSRAHRGWLHGLRLGILEIATPRPLAFIEKRRGLLVWKSYLVTEYVDGPNLYYFLRDDKTGEEERSAAMQQVAELLDRLGKYRITHGDLKHSNILITENGPVLTDLDGMKIHRLKPLFNRWRTKDLKCFAEGMRSGYNVHDNM